MPATSRNLLKIYGAPQRREVARGVMNAVFAPCVDGHPGIDSAPDVDGELLAAACFEGPAHFIVGWVADLSHWMVAETFELLTDPPCFGECNREIIKAGMFLDGCYPPGALQVPPDLPASPLIAAKLGLPIQHTLDPVAVARAKVDQGYVYVYESIEMGVDIGWPEKHEMTALAADIEAIKAILEPDQVAFVDLLQEQHRGLAAEMAARLHAVESLREAVRKLEDPHVANLLDADDRAVVDRLAQIIAKVMPGCDFEHGGPRSGEVITEAGA